MNRYVSEFIGTFTLVLLGCGTAVMAGQQVGVLGIAFAFGFALLAMAYAIGPISGCHINPAVSLGVFVAGRMTVTDLLGYVVAQILGGIAGAGVLLILARGAIAGYDAGLAGLGQNGWGPSYLGEYSIGSAMLFELIATFLFLVVILGSTSEKAPKETAGLAIGISLVAIHMFGIRIDGVSVNPARSLGPALFAGGKAMAQVWLFLIFPSIGGMAAGLLFRTRVFKSRSEWLELKHAEVHSAA
ncbi:MAG: aquaporin [Candidatus Sulfotelmatobacter sp.]